MLRSELEVGRLSSSSCAMCGSGVRPLVGDEIAALAGEKVSKSCRMEKMTGFSLSSTSNGLTQASHGVSVG